MNSLAPKILLYAFTLLLFAAFLGCSSQSYPITSDRTTSKNAKQSSNESRELKDFIKGGIEKKLNRANASPNKIINTAEKYLGVPHCMGGTTSKCMDCSGLLVTTFAAHKISLPHSSEEQARYGTIIYDVRSLRRGDLVFFTRSYRTSRFITHSGIYLGDNKFIHTSSSLGVTTTPLDDPWWSEKFVFGTRIF